MAAKKLDHTIDTMRTVLMQILSNKGLWDYENNQYFRYSNSLTFRRIRRKLRGKEVFIFQGNGVTLHKQEKQQQLPSFKPWGLIGKSPTLTILDDFFQEEKPLPKKESEAHKIVEAIWALREKKRDG